MSAMRGRGRARRDQRTRPTSAPVPTRCSTMWPMPTGVSTRPCFSASLRASSRPASERLRKPSSGRAASLAPTNRPSRANAAIGARCPRPGAAAARPAASRGRRFGGRDQDAVAAIGKIKPRAAAGDERAERRAEAAQPLQPDRAVRRQPAGELRHLAPVCDPPDRRSSRRALRHWPRRTAWRRPDWPTESACRRSTTARRAGRWSHAPPVADRRRLATGIPHCSSQRHDRLARRLPDDGVRYRRPNDDSLNGALVSPAGGGRSTAWRPPATSKAAITLIRLNPDLARCGVGAVANGDQRFTMGTGGRRVTPAKSLVDSLSWANGEAGPWMAPAIAQQEWDHERRWA